MILEVDSFSFFFGYKQITGSICTQGEGIMPIEVIPTLEYRKGKKSYDKLILAQWDILILNSWPLSL